MAESTYKPVLVVDDSYAMLAIVRAVLQRLGIEDVVEAHNGVEAVELLHRQEYGLVISDWSMEPMTGYELLRHIRADERLKAMHFVMMTVDTNPQKMLAAKKSGADACIIKPFSVSTLREKIGPFLDKVRNSPL